MKTGAKDKLSPTATLEEDVDTIMNAAQAADQLLEELHKHIGISVEAQAKIREHMVRDAQTAAKAIAAKYRTHTAAGNSLPAGRKRDPQLRIAHWRRAPATMPRATGEGRRNGSQAKRITSR